MIKKLILLCMIFALSTLLMASEKGYLDVVTQYIHGFTGNPSGALEMLTAFPNPNNYTAPALPDTQKETGFGLNRLIAYCATFWKKNVCRSHAYMGQSEDIEAIHQHVQQNIVGKPMILYGNCRGGSAALNYVAKYNPENLKAIVFEAIPADIPATLHPTLSRIGLSTNWDKTVLRLLLPAYPKDAITPLNAICKINNKKLPILLFHSRQDETVPFIQALQLYTTFKNNGFENVHLVVLPGKHVYLLRDCQQEYLTAVHSFYKQYGLVHNPKYATTCMKSYNYDIVQAQTEIVAYKKALQQKKEQSRKNLLAMSIVGIATVIAYQKLKPYSWDFAGKSNNL